MSAVPGVYTMPSNGVIATSSFNAGVHDPLSFLLNPPIAVLRQTAVQSISTATNTAVLFDTEDVDSAGGHSTSSNTSRYTAVYAGWYLCGGSVSYAASATGQRGAKWAVNGTQINPASTFINTTAAGGVLVPAPAQLIYLNVADYVELWAFQNSGGSINTQSTTTNQSCMSIVWKSN